MQWLKDAVLRVYTMGQNALSATGYNLIVVEEEAVPLAVGDMTAENTMLPFALSFMGVLLFATLCVMYWFKCRQYRMRIQRLNRGREPVAAGWNLIRLKETVSELEWKLAGK